MVWVPVAAGLQAIATAKIEAQSLRHLILELLQRGSQKFGGLPSEVEGAAQMTKVLADMQFNRLQYQLKEIMQEKH